MEWTKKWIEGSTYRESVCQISTQETKALKLLVDKRIEHLKPLVAKYRDIHESGEATTKQENALANYSDELDYMERMSDGLTV